VRLTPPVAYQEIAGTRRMLPAQYAISGDEYGFRVSGYDPTLPVVIDPLLQATPLGGSGDDQAIALAIGPAGDVYVAGVTASFNFPGTGPGAQPRFGGGSEDAFVARLTGDLTGFEEATFLGGSGDDLAIRLAIAPTTGDVYVTGRTSSIDLPGTNGGAETALDGGHLGGVQDGFVARLNASLTALRQATYLGGTAGDEGDALAIAPTTGEVYVAGSTSSEDFPGTAGGAQSVIAHRFINDGSTDVFVARLSADLTSLHQATYLGGNCPVGALLCRDLPVAMQLTTSDVYVAGVTDSTNFPGTVGGAQSASGGSTDAFVARLSTDLTALHQATYLGGANVDGAQDLAIAPTTGDVYIAGFTASPVFPGTAGGAQGAFGGGNLDAFVARLSADLSSTPTTTTTSSSTTTTRPTTTTTSTTRPPTTSTSSTTSSTTTTRPTTTTTSSTTTSSTTTTSLVVGNTPPTVSIDDLPATVKRTDLASGRLLTLHITVSEPATITLDILNGQGTSLRRTTLTRTSAGSFEAQISLRHLRGRLTLRLTATDVEGASSVVEQQFRVQ
jgi:hypothetical protein